MKRRGYMCPVCGFNALAEPAFDEHNMPSYEVCPCCGFEFGFDSQNDPAEFKRYRDTWMDSGAIWFISTRKPKGWNKQKQFNNITQQ